MYAQKSSSLNMTLLPMIILASFVAGQSSSSTTQATPAQLATTESAQLAATTTSTSTTTTTTTTTTQAPTSVGSLRPTFEEPPRRQQTINDDEYLIGVGIADITGPSADINLMGYAKPNQDAGGIHLRQFSRSVVIEDGQGKRVIYISIDNGMISQLLRVKTMEKLKQNYGETLYNENNVMMSATHSHSCPGGFFQYMLYNIPSAGFIGQTLDALVGGIVRSVDRASAKLIPGRIYYSEGELIDASINRSPTSYENNPKEERASYKYNTDKMMYLLKMVDRQANPIAMVNWFPVHGTSMNSSNHLISSDNKGYASLLFEEDFNPPGTLPGKGKFVAIFAQANEGDVSPNTRGPRCIDTGIPCESATSTCGNPPRNEKCIAFGPGKDMFESTKIIAYKQYIKARQLFNDESSMQLIRGPIRFIHEHIDITKQVVPLYKSITDLANLQQPNPQISVNVSYKTCSAGLGYSFAAGTTDGPGAFDFQQGDTISSRYWDMVRNFLRRPSKEQEKCHYPKPILLSTGEMDFPYMWHPRVVPTQIIMIGQLAIVGLPGEFTTMAGRRIHHVVQTALQEGASQGNLIQPSEEDEEDSNGDEGDDDDDEAAAAKLWANPNKSLQRKRRAYSMASKIKVVLSGLSNIYTSYITTIEEYELQRYEGASTLYGPHTLQAYANQFKRLASHLISGRSLPDNKLQPPDLTKSLFTLKPGVIYDGAPHGRNFGSVLSDVSSNKTYKCQDVVSVSFVAGNPRNNIRQEDSFLYVDKYSANGSWTPIASDGSWETKFIWERTNTFMGESKATIVWEIPHNCQPGIYRIRHYGSHKNLMQTISDYSGQSGPFKVSNNVGQSAQLDIMFEAAIESLSAQETEAINQKRLYQDSVDTSEKPSFYSSLSSLAAWLGLGKAKLS